MYQGQRQGSVFVVSGSSPLTREHTVHLEAACRDGFGQGQPRIVVNLQGTPLVDSAGLELLLDLRDRCLQRGGALHLAAPNPLVREILQATELAREFGLFDDVLSAIGSFSQ
jgi:anti-anti-sigma factor